jgi:hypothetical protein
MVFIAVSFLEPFYETAGGQTMRNTPQFAYWEIFPSARPGVKG